MRNMMLQKAGNIGKRNLGKRKRVQGLKRRRREEGERRSTTSQPRLSFLSLRRRRRAERFHYTLMTAQFLSMHMARALLRPTMSRLEASRLWIQAGRQAGRRSACRSRTGYTYGTLFTLENMRPGTHTALVYLCAGKVADN